MALHARHRILERLLAGNACSGVHQRVVGHHRLVHPVESQIVAPRRPKCTFLYAELIAVHRLAINHILVGRTDKHRIASATLHIKVVALCVCRPEIILFHIQMACTLHRKFCHSGQCFLRKVIQQHFPVAGKTELFIVQHLEIGKIRHRLFARYSQHPVQPTKSEASFRLSRFTHIQHRILHIGYLVGIAHKLQTPHRGLGIKVSRHQLFRAEHLVLCGHRQRK